MPHLVCVASEWGLKHGMVLNLANIYEFLSEKNILNIFFLDF